MEKTLRNINGVYYTIYMLTILSAVFVFMLKQLNINLSFIDEKSTTGIAISSLFYLYILISIPLSFWIFYKNTKKWQQLPDKFAKFNAYKKAAILRLWVIGLGLVTAVILYYLFNLSINMLYCAGILAIALFFCKPTVGRIMKDLNVEEEE